MKIAYVGVPVALGADRKGIDLAPNVLRESGVLEMMESCSGCYDMGNVYPSIIAEGRYSADKKVKFLSSIVDVNYQLRDKVSSIISQGYFPFVVGGDHSLGLGSVSGTALACDNLAVIWFDAHGDFNTEETSPSGNIHGMPCAALMGWSKSQLQTVATKILPSCNIYWIGARDLDAGEKKLAEEHNLHVYSTEDIIRRGMSDVMKEVLSDIASKSINNIHLSLDIDGMDPSIVCGTGTRVCNGLRNSDFYTFIDILFDTKKVVAMDFVEFNPLLDDENKTTLKWCLEAIHYLGLKIKQI